MLSLPQAYKQMVKLHFKRGKHKEMMTAYKQMLTYIKSAVTRNYSEKVINKILDLVTAEPGADKKGKATKNGGSDAASASAGASSEGNIEFFQTFYETTLTALAEAKNDRLWFKTNLKLGKLWFDREEYGRLQKILKQLLKACQDSEGRDDPSKGTQLLEVYALEIQMHTATKNTKKLKNLYGKALQVHSPQADGASPRRLQPVTRPARSNRGSIVAPYRPASFWRPCSPSPCHRSRARSPTQRSWA